MVHFNTTYINWFNPADPNFEEETIKTKFDMPMATRTTYDDGVSYIGKLEAEANFILAMDAINTTSYNQIMRIKTYVERRIALCKFFIPLNKRREFFGTVHAKLKPFYFKQQANEVLLALDTHPSVKEIKALKVKVYNLKIPFELKRQLWKECDKEITFTERKLAIIAAKQRREEQLQLAV